jgi:hypothetical protein
LHVNVETLHGKGSTEVTEQPVELNASQRRRLKHGAQTTVAASRADHLSDEDLAEVQAAAENVQRMQQAFADAQQQAEAYLRQARDRVIGATTVHEYLVQRTRQRYGLSEGEEWAADGSITRALAEQ